MPLSITPIYAGLLTLLLLFLSVQVILYRRSNRLSLGDEGDRQLLCLMRAQSNCAEYAPIGLFLLLLIELQGAQNLTLHALGFMLLAGRVLHGIGFTAKPMRMSWRVTGMALTLTMLGFSATSLIWSSLS